MKLKYIGLIFAFIVSVMVFASNTLAQDTWLDKTSVLYKATYASKYMWRGLDLQDDDPAFQSDLFIDIGSTGLYAGAFYSAATSDRDRWRIWDEIDAYLGYYSTLWQDKRYSIDYDAGFTHYYFFQQGREADTQEVALVLKMPKVAPLFDSFLVPRLKLHYGWSPFSDADSGFWVGVAGLYEHALPSAIRFQDNQTLSWKIESYHNDGAQGFEVHPGWSHILTGLATTVEWKGIGFTPEVYYQWSLEDTVDYENETWFMMTISRNIR